MMSANFRLFGSTALTPLLAAGVLVSADGALAQPGAASQPSSQEAVEEQAEARRGEEQVIFVTARRIEETVQGTPTAVTAYSDEQIESRQIEDVSDLADFVPGLEFEQAASIASSRPTIRGMSQLARVADESNVGIFVDGVYSSGLSGTDLPFEAIERVEIIRGPQSALYGRNTFAGSINYITRRPRNHLEYGGSATVGTHGRWGVNGYVSLPVVADLLAVRLDAGSSESGGFFRNRANDERLSNRESSFVRFAALFEPASNVEVYGSMLYRDESVSPSPLIVVADDDPRRAGKPAPTRRSPVQVGRRMAGPITDYTETYFFDPNATAGERENFRAHLGVNVDLGPVVIESLTGYDQRDVFTLVDLDQTPAGTLFGAIFHQTASGDEQDRNEFSQDIRLRSRAGGRLNWSIGGYFSRENWDQIDHRYADPALGVGGTTAPAPGPNGEPSTDDRFINRSRFHALYGTLDFDITPTLAISLEGRQTWERKSVRHIESNFGSDRGTFFADSVGTWSYFTPRGILSYRPSREVHVYASVARGAKSGGFNPTAIIPEEEEYRPEYNWTYELGTKLRLFNNRLHFDVAAFQVDWTDQQTLVFASGAATDTSIVGNLGQTRIRGIEAEGLFNFGNGLTMNFGYAYTDAVYLDAVITSFANFVDCERLPRLECPGGVTTGRVDGNRMQFIPRHAGNVGAQFVTPVGNGWDLSLRADVVFNSRKFVDAGNIGWTPGREDLRLRAGVQSDHYRLHAFCSNVLNDRTPVTAFVSRDFNGNPHYYVRAREGRMCGVTGGFNF